MKNLIICILIFATLFSCVGMYSAVKGNGLFAKDDVVEDKPSEDEVKDPVDVPSDDPIDDPSENEVIPEDHVHAYIASWITDANYHWRECACGAVDEKLVHYFTDWFTLQEPTETQPGSRFRTCMICYYKHTETLPALGEGQTDSDCVHEFSEATCVDASICSLCGLINGNALGHDFYVATCTTPKTCARCGLTDADALGHNYMNATCTTAKMCSLCGETEGEPLGHLWFDATCTVPKTCSRCGLNDGDALGHDLTSGDCVASVTCTRCDYVSGGHTYSEWVIDSAATVYEDGSRSRVCTSCGENQTEVIYATGTIGLSYELLADDTYSVSVGSAGGLEEIVIPAYYNGKPVTRVANEGFYRLTALKYLYMSDNVKVIEDLAFASSSLETVRFSQNLEEIGYSAFHGCDLTGDIVLPNGLLSIGARAFYSCFRITSFVVPTSVTEAYYQALDHGDWNKQMTIYYLGTETQWDRIESDGLKFVSSKALVYFECGGSLKYRVSDVVTGYEVSSGFGINDVTDLVIESVHQGRKVLAIGVFESSTLKSITIPTSILMIADNAFSECSVMTDIYYEGTDVEWDAIEKGEKGKSIAVLHYESTDAEQVLQYSDWEIGRVIMSRTNGNGDPYYVLGFSTTALKANTNYSISFRLKENSLTTIEQYLHPVFADDGSVQNYRLLYEPSYESGQYFDDEYFYYSPEELFENSYSFVSGAEGDCFVIFPFKIDSTDVELVVETARLVCDCIEDVVIMEVV